MVKLQSNNRPLQRSILPLDAQLNLPWDKYSDRIRHGVAIETRKLSADETLAYQSIEALNKLKISRSILMISTDKIVT
ncbi:hypothetical protein CXF72_00050 [Psychromonas sp. MB-3u-54]|uniref:hypothetical protein n=1 Tax=Psychromonas sp. MB-3u-54 TaxID=2058319 RepID=UPI000C332191|nr:hypothetical protein [Psychromonas sp. MB-3u-54]PKH04588.1 hypothetical protein CXF72_00050 [Psychromonas sp. MB-3u-54]